MVYKVFMETDSTPLALETILASHPDTWRQITGYELAEILYLIAEHDWAEGAFFHLVQIFSIPASVYTYHQHKMGKLLDFIIRDDKAYKMYRDFLNAETHVSIGDIQKFAHLHLNILTRLYEPKLNAPKISLKSDEELGDAIALYLAPSDALFETGYTGEISLCRNLSRSGADFLQDLNHEFGHMLEFVWGMRFSDYAQSRLSETSRHSIGQPGPEHPLHDFGVMVSFNKSSNILQRKGMYIPLSYCENAYRKQIKERHARWYEDYVSKVIGNAVDLVALKQDPVQARSNLLKLSTNLGREFLAIANKETAQFKVAEASKFRDAVHLANRTLHHNRAKGPEAVTALIKATQDLRSSNYPRIQQLQDLLHNVERLGSIYLLSKGKDIAPATLRRLAMPPLPAPALP